MKRFIVSVAIFLIPLFVILIVNYSIDNAYIFRTDTTYKKIGRLMSNGKNISNLYNFDEFLTRKYAIKQMTVSPEIVSFGSSRSMQVNNSVFNGHKFFNMGVSAISLKELIACYNVINTSGFKPSKIIIGIDYWFFIKETKLNRIRENFILDYNTYVILNNLSTTIKQNNTFDKYVELFNPVYFYENIKYGRKDYSITSEIFINEPVLCFDGSYVYSAKKRNSSEQEILNEARKQSEYDFGSFLHNYSVDIESQKLFEDFILLLNKKHEVIFFMPPYHPIIEEKLKLSDYKIVSDIENYVRHFALENNLIVMGSFFPSKYKYSLSSKDFYDGVHPKRETVEKILSPYFN